jgi:inosine/xanthosine triphosphate pyrophosphatase family protein
LLRWLLDSLRDEFNLITADQSILSPIEDGKDHPTTAIAKAKYWSKIVDGLAISSDGGLQIPALKDHWDSTKTNRAAGDNTSGQEKAQFLLSLMSDLVNEERRASWIESIAIANQGELVHIWTANGSMGYILQNSNGNVPDSLWTSSLLYFPRFKKTITQMSSDELTLAKDPWAIIKKELELFTMNPTWFV